MSFQPLNVTLQGKKFTGQGIVGKSWNKNGNPVILILPDALGCKTIELYRCLVISQVFGCSVAVVDLYGEELPMKLREDRANVNIAFDLMNNLLVDPIYLRKLFRTFVDEAVKQLNGDPNKLGAIGFCFGGGCVIEMLRDGIPLKVGVSMHGTFDVKPMQTLTGKPPPPMKTIKPPSKFSPEAHLLICHGKMDPLIPPKMLQDFEEEMEKAKLASFTFSSYGKVWHGFTAPNLDPFNGIIAFDANASRRAWISAFDLFSQVFDIPIVFENIPKALWTNHPIVPRL